jgi:hypothetical protein
MKKIVKGKQCDTETAQQLGVKYVGEFGQANGYEEQLFVNKRNQHFIYGNGGTESKYTRPTIELFTEEEAENWLKENGQFKKASEEKASKPKTSVKPKSTKTKKAQAKKTAKTTETPKDIEPVKKTDDKKDAEIIENK